MTKKDKESLLFHINAKAVDAEKRRQASDYLEIATEVAFWRGQYMAFNEMYSMVTNIRTDDETKD